jgi:L,D-peptidoglycan transpeptidase YkuD (ErfK/YbiS/YcfS/YnhG family)
MSASRGRHGQASRRRPAWALGALILVCALAAAAAAPPRARWADAQQLVLVTTAHWNASHGTLRTYSRDAHGWHQDGARIEVMIGRAGAAWGIGLHPPQPGPVKREGDGRSPAGVFALGTAFGYAATAATPLPYLPLRATDYCVDVSGSPLYNRIVDSNVVGTAAVSASTEPMRRDLHAHGDQAYKLGFVVEHNPHGTADAGSCIFVHLWKSPDTATSGCTAMAEAALRRLLAWLQPQRHPVFVLLPRAEYARLRSDWQLPELRD